jgi:hypothetical protein
MIRKQKKSQSKINRAGFKVLAVIAAGYSRFLDSEPGVGISTHNVHCKST